MIDLPQNRNYGLDVLRAVAIMFVLNVHSAQYFKAYPLLYKSLLLLNLDGVSLFFVLSGYLIGRILIHSIESGETSPQDLFYFWKRRWFRTLPNYFLILTILLFLGLANQGFPGHTSIAPYFFFLANFKSPMPDYLFPESWSLSIEEWFYIFSPICLLLLCRIDRLKNKRSILLLIIVTIILITAFRYYRRVHWPSLGYDDIDANFRKQVVTRLDGIMYGFIGAYLNRYHQVAWKCARKQLFVLGLVLLYSPYLQYLFGAFGVTYTSVFSFSVQSIGFLCLFPLITGVISGNGFFYKTISTISIISYSLYLINYSLVKGYIIPFLDRFIITRLEQFNLNVLNYFLFWIISFIIAMLLYKYYEKPFMNLRNRK